MFGSNKTIWLKAKRNLPVLLDTLISNLCLVRVHAFIAREISLLQSQNLSFRFSTSSVQSVQVHVENSQETARSQVLASASWNSESCVAGRTHVENSGATLRSNASSIELAFSSSSATVRSATSAFAFAERTFDFGLGRTLLLFSRKGLGLVCDGGQAVPSKSSHLPRSGASARQREHAGLVSGIHNDSRLHTQTDPGLGLRRDFGNCPAGHESGLGCTALPFSSHQSITELQRPTQSPLGG
jgi:hypothetical protein